MSGIEHIIDNRKVETKWAVPRDTSGKDASSSTIPATLSSSRYSMDVRERGDGGGVNLSKKIFVGGLHYETGDENLYRYFEQFGRIENAQVMFNRETDRSRGFGFVTFEDLSSVHNVMKFKVHTIDGKTVEVKRAVPKNDSLGIVSNASGRTERSSSFNAVMPASTRPYASSSAGLSVIGDRSRARAATALGVSSVTDSYRDSSTEDPFGYSRSSGDATFLQIASFGKAGKPELGGAPPLHAPDSSYANVISRAGGVWATNNRNNKIFSAEGTGTMGSSAVSLKPSNADISAHENTFIYNPEGVSFESSVRDLSAASPILDSSTPIPSFHTMSPMQAPVSLDAATPVMTSPLLNSNLATNPLDLNPVLGEPPATNENIFNVNSFGNPGYGFPAFGEIPSVYGGGFSRDHTPMGDGNYVLGHPTNMYGGGHAAPFYSNTRFENFTPLNPGHSSGVVPPGSNGGRPHFMTNNDLGGSLHSLRPSSDASGLVNSFEGLNISGSARGNNLWASSTAPVVPTMRESGGPPLGSSSTSKPAGAKSNAWF
jgi:RNA recognition motif-containing protein